MSAHVPACSRACAHTQVLRSEVNPEKACCDISCCWWQVNGVDVRNATHDEAVEVIRNASSPVRFMVQSLVDSSCVSSLFFLFFNNPFLFC